LVNTVHNYYNCLMFQALDFCFYLHVYLSTLMLIHNKSPQKYGDNYESTLTWKDKHVNKSKSLMLETSLIV
jgi:hypothetical protein